MLVFSVANVWDYKYRFFASDKSMLTMVQINIGNPLLIKSNPWWNSTPHHGFSFLKESKHTSIYLF